MTRRDSKMAEGAAPVLSTAAENILERQVENGPPGFDDMDDERLGIMYEIDRTVAEIRRAAYQRVALQFPDNMLHHAPRLVRLLQGRLRSSAAPETASLDESSTKKHEEPRLFILGDTSYGSCCIDEIAAAHADADVVVHYGRACLSPTAHLPVLHVYTRQPGPSVQSIADEISRQWNLSEARIVIMTDVVYDHLLAPTLEELHRRGHTNVVSATIYADCDSIIPNRRLPMGLQADTLRQWHLFHIGNPPTALHLMLSSKTAGMCIYAPSSPEDLWESANILSTRDLARRYALVTACSSARVFGILINTLSVKNHQSIVDQVKRDLRHAGRHSYTFVVGKVNAAKLANFAEIDAWVVIGCWESSLIESRDFWKPLITPFELALALQEDKSRVWTGEWVSDYQKLLRADTQKPFSLVGSETERSPLELSVDEQIHDDESAAPEFDLRTGRLATRSQSTIGDPAPSSSSTTLTRRMSGHLISMNGQPSAGAEYLRGIRTWQGLGSDFGNLEVPEAAPLESGRSGLARGYSQESAGNHEPTKRDNAMS